MIVSSYVSVNLSSEGVNRIKGKDGPGWLLLDSIATLLVFNSPDSLLEFLHFLLGRLRVLGFDGVVSNESGFSDWKTPK